MKDKKKVDSSDLEIKQYKKDLECLGRQFALANIKGNHEDAALFARARLLTEEQIDYLQMRVKT